MSSGRPVTFPSWREASNALLCSVSWLEGEPGPGPLLPGLCTPCPSLLLAVARLCLCPAGKSRGAWFSGTSGLRRRGHLRGGQEMLVQRGSLPCPLFVSNPQPAPGSPSNWVSPPGPSGPLPGPAAGLAQAVGWGVGQWDRAPQIALRPCAWLCVLHNTSGPPPGKGRSLCMPRGARSPGHLLFKENGVP